MHLQILAQPALMDVRVWGCLGFGFFGRREEQFELQRRVCLKNCDRDIWVLLVALITNCWMTFYK